MEVRQGLSPQPLYIFSAFNPKTKVNYYCVPFYDGAEIAGYLNAAQVAEALL